MPYFGALSRAVISLYAETLGGGESPNIAFKTAKTIMVDYVMLSCFVDYA